MKTKLFMLLFTILLSSEGLIAEDKNFSTQWQRIQLETRLKNRLSGVIGLLVDQKKFFVEVSIKATAPNLSLPKFKMPKTKSAADIKFTNEKSKGRKSGELILFDKIGLMAPLFQGNSDKSDKELQVKFFQYKKKIERELVTKTDLFKLIETLKVTIAFDESIPKEKSEEIKKLVESIIPGFGDVKPTIEILNIAFKKEVVVKEKTLIEKYLPHLSGPIGILLATLLFCLTSFIIFSGFKKIQQQVADTNSAAVEKQNDTDTEEAMPNTEGVVDPNFRPGSPQLMEAITSQEEGIKRLFIYLDKSYDQACDLVKKWINLNSMLSNATLVVLSERMSVDELYKVFAKLTDEERETWIKVSSNSEISPDMKNQADGFIAQQVLEDIMTVSATEDEELQKLLVELSPSKAAQISRNDNDHGALLVNLMSSSFLGQMYLFLSNEEISAISLKGLEVQQEDIKDKSEDIKLVLQDFVETKYANPFSRRIVEVISELDPLKQQNMMNVLLESNQVFIIKDVVRNIIPVKIIEELPSDMLKVISKNMPNEKKLNFLISLEETKRTEYIDSTTQEGTKGRDVLDFELQKILDDEDRVTSITNKKDQIYNEYIQFARALIKEDKVMNLAIKDIIDGWIESLDSNVTKLDVNKNKKSADKAA
jgi:hypothetical protein